jgi:integrase
MLDSPHLNPVPASEWHALGPLEAMALTDRQRHLALKQVLSTAQLASPLMGRPYDFRHGGISWRLNAGTPVPLVAEWAGHTVEVLLRIYAHCIDGDDERWFGPVDDALGRD